MSALMQSSVAAGPQRPRSVFRFVRAREGSAAIEFGIVAVPFFALLFALIEVGLVFFANFTLENAVDQASRMIRTGQAQTAGFSQSKFKNEICTHVYGLLDCANGLKIDVRKFDKFGNVVLPEPLDENGKMKEGFQYDPGKGGDIVVVRAFYEWDLIASIPGAGLGNMANGSRLLEATAAFRNEPYDSK